MLRPVLAVALCAALSAPSVAQTTWYVDVTATPPGNGTLGSPYASIQHAIAQPTTVNGDTVLVLPGTYVENLDFLGKAVTVQSQQGAGATVVDGNQAGAVVSFQTLEGAGSVLRGFTLTNGSGFFDPLCCDKGGGVYCMVASPVVEDCEIVGNGPGDAWGGGVFVSGGSPVFRRCLVAANGFIAQGRGGAVYVENAVGVTFDDCDLDQNAAIVAGAMYVSAASVSMTGGRVFDNRGPFDAGGILCVAGANLDLDGVRLESNATGDGTAGAVYFQGNQLTMTDCAVVDNFVDNDHRGGGVLVDSGTAVITGGCFERNFSAQGGGLCVAAGASATVEGVVFRENTSWSFQALDGAGGGMYVAGGGSATVTRCAFLDNESREGPSIAATGGGLSGPAVVDRCTFVGNTATTDGGGVAGATVSNSILWANLLNGVPDQADAATSVAWSDVEGGAPGAGNLALEPDFWSLSGRDVRLRPGSPAIDAGDPGAPLDPDGSRADMGAYPFDPTWVSPPFTYCTAKTNSFACVPFLEFAGTPSATSTAPFDIRAVDVVPAESGLLLWSFKKANLDFHGGKLCVKAPFKRTAAKAAKNVGGGCSGWILTRDFQKTILSKADPLLTAGQTLYAQWQQRDPGDPAGFGDGLSDGLRFVLAP